MGSSTCFAYLVRIECATAHAAFQYLTPCPAVILPSLMAYTDINKERKLVLVYKFSELLK